MIVSETLSIETVRPGRRLAQAVLDARGRVVLPAGSELSEEVLQALRRQGVDSLHVECGAGDAAPSAPALRQQVERDLAQRFRQAGEAAETAILRAVLLDYLSAVPR